MRRTMGTSAESSRCGENNIHFVYFIDAIVLRYFVVMSLEETRRIVNQTFNFDFPINCERDVFFCRILFIIYLLRV